MMVFLFALGRAGCGKTTATLHMIECVQSQGWNTIRLNDYEILYNMFRSGDQRFRPISYDGFDVTDFVVLDEVLSRIQDKASALERKFSKENTLITIEFARDDYHHALAFFKQEFLKRSYFLFVDAELETCIRRIHERVTTPPIFDNHFVSDEIVRGYYGKNSLSYMRDDFSREFGIDPQRVKIIENNGSLDKFIGEVDRFLQEIMQVPAQVRAGTCHWPVQV